MADEQRMEVLEQHVRAIYDQLDALRAELGARGAGSPRRMTPEPAQPPPPSMAAPSIARKFAPEMVKGERPRVVAPPPPPPPRIHAQPKPQPDIDLEKLFGRYGTLAVASLAILMGVGTFLSWAIEHGHLGPTVRVILGFIGAGIVAALGIWVREKRDVRFGNVLLALSLAIVHIDAWAAGPFLHVLGTIAALSIAALASAALAALALTSEERTLFAIGFAGALAAPFVTASEPGSIVMLLTYGWVVIALSLFAIREKGWEPVLWMTLIGATLYVLAAIGSGPGADHGWLAAHAPVVFGFACAAAALLFARDSLRSKLGLAFLLLASLSTLGYTIHARQLEVGVSLVGTLAAYLVARELETEEIWLVLGNVVVPLAFLFATVVSANDRMIKALAAAALTVVASFLAWEDEEERSGHLFVAAIASGVAIVAYLVDFDTRCITALALHAALFTIILRGTRAKVLLPPIAIGLFAASVWTMSLLTERPQYQYTPFLTIPSACAAVVVAAWAFLAYALSTLDEQSIEDKNLARFIGALAILAAFTWIRQELADGWSAETSSYALIVYYALAAALVTMFFRRTRAKPLLVPIVILLLVASWQAMVLLTERVQYQYTPFLTIPSACAAVVVTAWAFLAHALRTVREQSEEDKTLATLIGGLAILAGFTWIRQELVDAWSADTSSFALIIYYALAGLALIFAGRYRRVGLWRAAGLALAFYAGYKTLVQTFTIDAVGLRVGARILVGAFLAAVAYWYRVPHTPGTQNESPIAPPAGTEQAPEPL